MLDIRWGQPYKVYSGPLVQWRREWCIPSEYLSGFFEFWKKHKFKMLVEGFTVTKSVANNKWYLFETKDAIGQFKSLGSQETEVPYVEPHPGFILPEYNIKDTKGLRPWQVDAVGRLVSSIQSWGAAVDGSDCGVGKTYSACAVAREMGYDILVVCPKAVIKSWKKVVCNHFKMKNRLVGVVNYEKLRNGRTDSEIASFVLKRHTKRSIFKWKVSSRKTLIIWDESQKMKNWSTKNAKVCQTAIKEGFPMLFLSATIATNPLELRAVGLAIKVFKAGNKAYWDWARSHGVYKGRWGMEFNNDPVSLKRLHHTIFDQSGVRLRRDDIPGFPECEIIPEIYNMDEQDVDKINGFYDEMERELEFIALKERGDQLRAEKKKLEQSELSIQLRARQKIEIVKVPLIVEMVEEALAEGFSVAVFINFTETMDALSKKLKTKCIFDGRTPDKIRDKNVEDFQADRERVILINMQSGGAGLSLHDLNGKFPRMSLISPSYSAVFMRQAFGRIWRDDAKTKAIQKIICVANTVEENVYINCHRKLDNLDMLNDGDIAYAKNYEIINN